MILYNTIQNNKVQYNMTKTHYTLLLHILTMNTHLPYFLTSFTIIDQGWPDDSIHMEIPLYQKAQQPNRNKKFSLCQMTERDMHLTGT